MTEELKEFIQSKDVRLFVLNKAISYVGEVINETIDSYEIKSPMCIHRKRLLSYPSDIETIRLNKESILNASALGLASKKFYYDQLMIFRLKVILDKLDN